MSEQVIDLPIEKVLDSTVPNYRKHLGPLEQMADSMKSAGVLEPLVVRARGKQHELVFGYKRRAAAKKAGLPTVPCIVRQYTDDQVLTVRIIENSQREDAHPMDEARGFEVLLQRDFDVSKIAEKIGRPASYVAQRLALLKLCKEARQALDDDDITLTVGAADRSHSRRQAAGRGARGRSARELRRPDEGRKGP